MKKKRIAALLCSLSLINGKNIQNNVQAMQPSVGNSVTVDKARLNNILNKMNKSTLLSLIGKSLDKQVIDSMKNLTDEKLKQLVIQNIDKLGNKEKDDVNKIINIMEEFDQYIKEVQGKYNGPEDKRLVPKEFINSEVQKIYEQYLKPEFVAIQKKYVNNGNIKLDEDIDIIPIFTGMEDGHKVNLLLDSYDRKPLDDNTIVDYDIGTDKSNWYDKYGNKIINDNEKYKGYYLIPTKMIKNNKEFWEYYNKKLKEYAHAEDFFKISFQAIMMYGGKYLLIERGVKYGLKLLAELAAASLLVTVGVKYALHRANKSEQVRRKKVEYDRKMKNQNDFDEMMKRINGHSSINYDKPWNEIEEIFEKLKDKAPHNAESIEKIKIKIKDFYSQSKANNFSKCIGISVNGTPGCGKTSFFLELMKNLGAEQPVIIGPADFDVDHKFLNVNQQVSGKWHIGSNERGYYAYGKLVAAIKHNEHPIIIVDELDKLPKSLRTLLWNAFKTGEIEIEGKKQSCKGAIFLFPCNQPLDDETKNISEFKFNTPNKESYKKALAKILTQIASFAKEKYKLDLEYSDSILDWMAQKCVNDDEGMRSIKVCKRFINSAIEVKYNSTYESKILTRLKLDKDETGHLICVEP